MTCRATVIEGRDPLGYLAGVGLMAILPDLRLRWGAGPYHRAEIDADPLAVASAVTADASRYKPEWIDGRADEIEPIDALDIMRGEIDRDGITPKPGSKWAALWMHSGQQEPMRSGRILRDLVAADPLLMREAIIGDGRRPIARRAVKHADLRLSHTAGRPAALRAIRPADDPEPVVVGLQWLAWRGVVEIDWREPTYLDLALWDDWRTLATRQAEPAEILMRCAITRDGYGYGSIAPASRVLTPRKVAPADGEAYAEMRAAQRKMDIMRRAMDGDAIALDVATESGWL